MGHAVLKCAKMFGINKQKRNKRKTWMKKTGFTKYAPVKAYRFAREHFPLLLSAYALRENAEWFRSNYDTNLGTVGVPANVSLPRNG